MSNLKKDIQKLKVPKTIVWVDGEHKIETTHLLDKTVNEIINLIESVVGKVIGQDELFEPLPQHIETDDPEIFKPIHDTKRDCRNDLRKAQRKTFKDIKSKLIGEE